MSSSGQPELLAPALLRHPFLLELPQSHNLAGEPFPRDLPSMKFWVRLFQFCSYPFIFPPPKQGELAKKHLEYLHTLGSQQ